jgi:acetate---CoA ligase (ADP-forming)
LMTGYFGGYSSGEDGLTGLGPAECAAAKQIAADSAGTKPTAVQSIFPQAPACEILRDGGVPVFAAIEDAAAALVAVTTPAPTATGMGLPSHAQPVTATDYTASRDAFAAAGIEFVAAAEVRTADELSVVADELRPPFVLKALGLLHKSDAGGVVVGIPSREALLDTHARLVAELDPASFSVEEMADLKRGVELIVGVRWDPRFGPVVLVGMGGTATEVLRDVAVALAPVTETEAVRMLEGLRTAPLLHQYRGRAAVDIAAAARAVALLSEYAAAHPEIAELEINPLLVTPSGATALDARIVKHQ